MQKLNLLEESPTPHQTAKKVAASSSQEDAYSVESTAFTPATPVATTTFMSKIPKRNLSLLLGAVAILAGVGTGFGAVHLQARQEAGITGPVPMQQVAGNDVSAGDVFGVADEKTFKDSAEGYLEAGGFESEGTHRLLRPGGDSQTVYLTSTVTDLNKLEGMEVKVWGETFKGQQTSWLMDVGRVQVLNPTATAPVAE